ncbi:MAG TPA: nucleotidyltransferase family protein [Solirubrobacteraceae bacterium]
MDVTERLLDEGPQLVRESEENGLSPRLFGGVGIRTLLGERFDPAFARPLHDIDLFVRKRDSRKLEALITAHGWEPEREFNALNGARRLLFDDPGNAAQIDVFVEVFEMCHALPLSDGLREPGLTLPGTELLMTKLQIVHLNAKDREDCYALLSGCTIGDTGPATIDPARIAHLTARNWGLQHSFELNLSRLASDLDARSLPAERNRVIAEGIAAISAAIDAEPKSRGWRLRAKIGERKQWYEEPEEVRR